MLHAYKICERGSGGKGEIKKLHTSDYLRLYSVMFLDALMQLNGYSASR